MGSRTTTTSDDEPVLQARIDALQERIEAVEKKVDDIYRRLDARLSIVEAKKGLR